MKILYLAPFRDMTGYGTAAISNILSLDAAGVDVVPRPIKLNNRHGRLPERILELEDKSEAHCDVVIQHILPSFMEKPAGFKKSIGVYCSETSDFKFTDWPEKLNLLDEAWVTCQQMVSAARASDVTIPLKVLPYAVDTEKFSRKFPLLNIPELRGKFTFYTVADFNARKNLAALLIAFHTEFLPDEPVELLLKVSKEGYSDSQLHAAVSDLCSTVKRNLFLYASEASYKQEIIITSFLDEETLCSLHKSCDCFVLPSHGESWSLPCMDAMGFGNSPIVTNIGGFTEYIDNEVGYLVDCTQDTVFGSDNPVINGRQTWAKVNIQCLRAAMREAYENKSLRQEKAVRGQERVKDFSYANVGKLMRSILEN